MKFLAAVALLSVGAVEVSAGLGKPVLFDKGLNTPLKRLNELKRAPTKDRKGVAVPEICKKYAKGVCDVNKLQARRVKYSDCDEPWTICRCEDANMSMDTLEERWGTVPPGIRSYTGAILATKQKSCSGLNWGGGKMIRFQGNCGSSVFLHEAGHSLDKGMSKSDGFKKAIADSKCVPDGYSNSSPGEDWTQNNVLVTYAQHFGGKSGIKKATGKSVSCLAPQFNMINNDKRVREAQEAKRCIKSKRPYHIKRDDDLVPDDLDEQPTPCQFNQTLNARELAEELEARHLPDEPAYDFADRRSLEEELDSETVDFADRSVEARHLPDEPAYDFADRRSLDEETNAFDSTWEDDVAPVEDISPEEDALLSAEKRDFESTEEEDVSEDTNFVDAVLRREVEFEAVDAEPVEVTKREVDGEIVEDAEPLEVDDTDADAASEEDAEEVAPVEVTKREVDDEIIEDAEPLEVDDTAADAVSEEDAEEVEPVEVTKREVDDEIIEDAEPLEVDDTAADAISEEDAEDVEPVEVTKREVDDEIIEDAEPLEVDDTEADAVSEEDTEEVEPVEVTKREVDDEIIEDAEPLEVDDTEADAVSEEDDEEVEPVEVTKREVDDEIIEDAEPLEVDDTDADEESADEEPVVEARDVEEETDAEESFDEEDAEVEDDSEVEVTKREVDGEIIEDAEPLEVDDSEDAEVDTQVDEE